MTRKIISLLLCLVTALLCGCAADKGADASSDLTDYPAKAFDITVEKCPQKVVSLSPEVTDVIIALGSDAQLVGISDNCVEHRGLKRMGTSLKPDITALKTEKPALVFMSDSADEKDISALKKSGIAVAIVPTVQKYTDLPALYNDVAVLMSGEITGVRNASNTILAIDTKLKTASNKNSKSITAAVFINEKVTIPDGCFAAELAKYAGIGKLVGGSDEKIIGSDIDLILCPAGTLDAFSARFPDIKTVEFDMSRFDRRGGDMVRTVTDIIAVITEQEKVSENSEKSS